jgi:hypothetical protein
MTRLTALTKRPYRIYFAGEPVDPSLIVDELGKGRAVEGKGRGGITLITLDVLTLACRKYVHGGLFRAITGDTFFSARRAIKELEITCYLHDKGFPVVEPFAAVIKCGFLTKELHLLTLYKEGAVDLLDFLAGSERIGRLRAVRRLARLFYQLETLGVRHPDLHLNNVLVTPTHDLLFLDFDKARIGTLTGRDMIRMFWRLNRYAEKMERKGAARFSDEERIFFLRTYTRLSGRDVSAEMTRRAGSKKVWSRVGWFVEKVLYGR